jgi:hypothetical protein
LEITKTVLSLMLQVITTLTALTTIAAAYAGGGEDDDGNKQKAEDDSAAAIADCDDNNDVEQAGFDCIAIAANDVEIELPEESATLSVCKDEEFENTEPSDFFFSVTGNNPSPDFFPGDRDCVDVTIGPGEYAVSEAAGDGLPQVEITGDCVRDPNAPLPGSRATGEIQAGETQVCRFRNFAD